MKFFSLLFVLLATIFVAIDGAYVRYYRGPYRSGVVYRGRYGGGARYRGPYASAGYRYRYRGRRDAEESDMYYWDNPNQQLT